MTEVWTVARMLGWSDGYLQRSGSSTARLDAELLLGEALGMRRLDLYLAFDRPMNATELAAYKQLVIRRATMEPVAYILGRKAFYDIELAVGPGVLVPRPETETLVDRVLEFMRQPDSPDGAILDLCTGSGAIALAIAKGLEQDPPNRTVCASDISPEALAYASRNTEALGLSDRVCCCHSDLFDGLGDDSRFAVIASNPPYVIREILATLDATVRDFEPALALDGGEDGRDILRRLASLAPPRLVAGGMLAVEVGSKEQGDWLSDALQATGLLHVDVEPLGGQGPTCLVTARSATVPEA